MKCMKLYCWPRPADVCMAVMEFCVTSHTLPHVTVNCKQLTYVSIFTLIVHLSSLISSKVLEIYGSEYLQRRETPEYKFSGFHGGWVQIVVFWVDTCFKGNLTVLSILRLHSVGWYDDGCVMNWKKFETGWNPNKVQSCQLPGETDENHWLLPKASL